MVDMKNAAGGAAGPRPGPGSGRDLAELRLRVWQIEGPAAALASLERPVGSRRVGDWSSWISSSGARSSN